MKSTVRGTVRVRIRSWGFLPSSLQLFFDRSFGDARELTIGKVLDRTPLDVLHTNCRCTAERSLTDCRGITPAVRK